MPERFIQFNSPRDPMQTESPVNPLPPVVIALCLVAVVVELILSAGATGFVGGAAGVGWRLAALQDYSVSPAVLEVIVTRGDFGLDLLKRFVTYPFVHASFTSALFGAALLLALGKFVGDIFHPAATLALFVLSAVGGALVFCLVFAGASPLFGLWTPVYGLIGGYTYVVWLSLGRMGQNQLQAFRLIGFLLGLQLLFGLLFGSNGMWVAELAGFATGFAVSPILAPGGWTALLRRLRSRS